MTGERYFFGTATRRKIHSDEDLEELPEPKTKGQRTIRQLAEAAIGVTMHDVGDDLPEYRNAIKAMESRFAKILKGKLKV